MGLILIRIYQYIGKMVTDFLGLSNRVNLYPQKFQGYLRDKQYSVIFSFASHWTDDEQLRPDFGEYIQQLHGLLKNSCQVRVFNIESTAFQAAKEGCNVPAMDIVFNRRFRDLVGERHEAETAAGLRQSVHFEKTETRISHRFRWDWIQAYCVGCEGKIDSAAV